MTEARVLWRNRDGGEVDGDERSRVEMDEWKNANENDLTESVSGVSPKL